jgi:hypothetical protein
VGRLSAGGATQIVYDQIVKVVTIGRGVGAWGDMVITLKNGDNVEFRSLPQCVPFSLSLTLIRGIGPSYVVVVSAPAAER